MLLPIHLYGVSGVSTNDSNNMSDYLNYQARTTGCTSVNNLGEHLLVNVQNRTYTVAKEALSPVECRFTWDEVKQSLKSAVLDYFSPKDRGAYYDVHIDVYRDAEFLGVCITSGHVRPSHNATYYEPLEMWLSVEGYLIEIETEPIIL